MSPTFYPSFRLPGPLALSGRWLQACWISSTSCQAVQRNFWRRRVRLLASTDTVVLEQSSHLAITTGCSGMPAGERPGIVVLTIGLEESLPKLPGAVLPSKLWSPYRLPLIRFLNQYPTEWFGRECKSRWACCALLQLSLLNKRCQWHNLALQHDVHPVQRSILLGVTKPVGQGCLLFQIAGHRPQA